MPRATRFFCSFFLLFVPLLACGGGSMQSTTGSLTPPLANAGNQAIDYTLVVHEDLKVDEQICWRGFDANVVPEMPAGRPFATAPVKSDNKKKNQSCASFTVDLDAMATALDDEAAVAHVGSRIPGEAQRAVIGSFDPWLWRVEPWPKGLHARLTVEAPPGITVSLPHHRLPAAESSTTRTTTYDMPFSTWTFMARFAIGKGFNVDERDVAGTHLSIVTMPGAMTNASQAGIRRFVEGAASAVATIDESRMAVDHVQVLLRAGRGRGGGGGGGGGANEDAVTFGMAMRGGGPAITLNISSGATDERLYGEWITVHELSHLWLPPVARDDAWMSEGFASYYQCILRSRVGMYDEKEGWSELLAGLARGKQQAGTLPLRQARRPRFQHIYWGGAAIALKLDVLLRRNGSSLDAMLTHVRRTIDDSDDRSADDMVRALFRTAPKIAALDSKSGGGGGGGGDIIALLHQWLAEPFPDTTEELQALGVIRSNGSRTNDITLDDAAPFGNIRRAIAASRTPSSSSNPSHLGRERL